MSEQETMQRGSGINIQRVNIHATIFIVATPLALIGLVVFATYAITHFHDFVGASASIFSWLLFFGGMCLYAGLAFFVGKIVLMVARGTIENVLLLARGCVEVYQRFSEARGQRMKNNLLHVSDKAVVYVERGQIVVNEIGQERRVYSIRQDERAGATVAELPTHTQEALPSPVQSFNDLLVAGVVQSALQSGKMLLGYAGGQLRYGSWLDLYSCGIGGVSGSGKTTTVRFLLFQAILAGARLLMIDPHIEDPDESLAAQFRAFTHAHLYAPCDDNTTAVLKRVRWLTKELARRKGAGIKTPFVIFVVDEFNAVMRIKEVRDEMSELLVAIAQEGRKFGLFAMLIGQRWSHQDIGGADIRTSLASTLSHRFTDEAQAKLLAGSKHGPKCLELPTGHFLFRDTNGTLQEIITPYTEVEDGAIIQRLLQAASEENTPENRGENTENTAGIARKHEAPHALLSDVKPVENTEETSLKVVPANADMAVQEKLRRVVQLHASGKNKAEIIRAIWGVSPGASVAYEQANAEYQRLMQMVYEQLGA